MRILLTGGAGYIGSTLTPLLLRQGHSVRVLDALLYGGSSLLGVWPHPEFEFIQGDVRDQLAVQDAVKGMDAVVHLAAIVGDPACAKQPEEARSINQDASLALVEECRRAGVGRFIFASTCSNYGRLSEPEQLADESWQLSPLSLYAETKVAIEEAVLDRQEPAFSPTVVRFATVYGVSPRMRFDLTVNEFTMEMATAGRLTVFGEQFWRPYVHVVDAARAVALILGTPVEAVQNQVFNVGATNQNFQKQQLVDLIKPYAPHAQIDYVHKEEDPRDYRVSFEKIKDSLGYSTTLTVEDGIREVAQLVEAGIIKDYQDSSLRN
ncbi:NAD(P)-dependent oxidoreductase [Dehalococcoidia bacterium]|nr:NAD(P)-dependent oxidoreductase [Dehalococcoidia bacterium]